MFPDTFNAPPLVPEAADQETPLEAEEIGPPDDTRAMIERVTVTEHYLLAERVSVTRPECLKRRRKVSA
jgi:hypothetical protein